MKRAKLIKVFQVEIECPYCGETIEGPNALAYTEEEYTYELGATVHCENCGQDSATPPNPWQPKARRALQQVTYR